ncbi:MAG: ATP-binding cassette domain-containing protein [Candidatus Omnitrophica bacterium]|nr:ATP-binding cassette domain-containing protein [Candidatus Omnitrophota bacterium]
MLKTAGLDTHAANLYNPCLIARDVWFSYDGHTHILKGINLMVERGIMTMILGRSGSGKTTLLRLLKGLLHPQKGSVEVRFSAAGRIPDRIIAYVPQHLGLVRNLTAVENVLIGCLSSIGTIRSILRAFPKTAIEEAQEILRELGLSHKMDEPVSALSGGQRQRVAIARALMLKPEMILADEFVSQLDPVTTREMFVIMHRFTKRGVGFLMTTHETDLVADYADRIVIMKEGVITYEGQQGGLSEPEMIELLG